MIDNLFWCGLCKHGVVGLNDEGDQICGRCLLKNTYCSVDLNTYIDGDYSLQCEQFEV